MHIRDIPQEWIALLDEIRHIAPDAHIAGGALRDLDNGRPVKDIDIFVAAEHDVEVELLGMELGFERDGAAVDLSSMVGSDPAVRCSVTWKKEGHLPVNLIYLVSNARPVDNLHRLDLGLCQIAYDGQGIIQTNAYRLDKEEGTMTVVRADNLDQLQRTFKRHDRLSGKYPLHTLQLPPKFRYLVLPWESRPQ